MVYCPPPPKPRSTPTAPVLENGRKRRRGSSVEGKYINPKRLTAVFNTGDDLLAGGVEYLEWCRKNPYQEGKATVQGGKIIRYGVARARIPTLIGFATYHGISRRMLNTWIHHEDPDISEAAEQVHAAIKAAQIELGAARLADPMISARVAGLAERTENAITNQPPPPPPQKQSPDQVADVLHPDMTYEQEMQLRESGLPIPLYSPAQIEQGIPFTMPKVPE